MFYAGCGQEDVRFQVFCFGGDFVKDHKTFDKEQDKESEQEKAQRDNRANQLNPNNVAYWSSRGYTEEKD